MIDQELLKYGFSGIVLYIVVKECFGFAKGHLTKETGRLKAGDLSPEYYDKRFDKIDSVQAGMVEILKQLTSIQSDMRDMIRDERARHYEGD
jgi:hypothetical protein